MYRAHLEADRVVEAKDRARVHHDGRDMQGRLQEVDLAGLASERITHQEASKTVVARRCFHREALRPVAVRHPFRQLVHGKRVGGREVDVLTRPIHKTVSLHGIAAREK
jgi:hypothetical protein